MRIIIGADLVPTKSNFDLFRNGDIETLVGKRLCKLFSDCDYKIFNLEAPLTDKESPIVKSGPNLSAPCAMINGIKKLGVDLFTLANNHIMDQGVEGMHSTLTVLKENNINYVGAGENIEEAQKPFIIERNGLKVGIYACAEHEFSIAGKDKMGANPFEPLESLDHILELKKECDYVIVLYHGGKEHYRYPSPYLQKICRRLVDKGADLVITQHSHCIGAEEIYKDSTIIYGQGNFLFDYADNEFWQTGMLVEVVVKKDCVDINYIPIKKEKQCVRMACESETEIMKGFYNRSEEIKNENYVEQQYARFSREMFDNYARTFLGKVGCSVVFRICNKLLKHRLSAMFFSKQNKIVLYNYIMCEAHRELLLEGCKNET